MDREENRTQTISNRIDPSPPDPHTIDRLLAGAHHDPHGILGAHSDHTGKTDVRAYRPGAKAVAVLAAGERTELDEVADGFFAGTLTEHPGPYRL